MRGNCYTGVREEAKGKQLVRQEKLSRLGKRGWSLQGPFGRRKSLRRLWGTALGLAAGSLGLRFLGQQDSLDVGQDTTLCDGHARQEFVQLLVVTDGQLQMTGDDSGLLVVTGSVACQLQNFSSQVLEHGSQVDGSTGTHTLGVVTFTQKTVDTAHGELQSSAG